MTQEFNSDEIYDIAQAFITDKDAIFKTELTDSKQCFNFKKTFDISKYTLQIVLPATDVKQDYGRIYFQENENKPILLLKTNSKISANPYFFKKMIDWRYFKLISMIKKRKNNSLSLSDNYITIMSAIFNLKSL